MPSLIDFIHSKLELFRLEQRYTRRRNRRSTFVSEAQYVDGEYIYSPKSTYRAQVTGGSNTSSDSNDSSFSAESTAGQQQATKEEKMSRRLSTMAKGAMDWRKGKEDKSKADRRLSRVSVREIQWDGGVRS